MNIGSTYEFYVPSELGYGEKGLPGLIEPNEPLMFTYELLDIKGTSANSSKM